MRLAYFGHDSSDAAIRKRVNSFREIGVEIDGYMMTRDPDHQPGWKNVDLGVTKNGAYLHRVYSIFKGAFAAGRHKRDLVAADAMIARNFDMLATAYLTKLWLGLKTPVIYECLDIHRLLCREDLIGRIARGIEGRLLKRSAAVLVSSPAFVEHHFKRHYAGLFRAFLIENRLTSSFADSTPRPVREAQSQATTTKPLKIGWVGILRCQRTLELLDRVSRHFAGKVEIRIHGKPDLWSVPEFHETVSDNPHMVFSGAYRAPEDLPAIYQSFDLTWTGDFMEEGLNSTWLLPNRIYEGGYFAAPFITPAGTQTASWISDHNSGITLSEPLEQSLTDQLKKLLDDRSEITRYRNALLDLPKDTFVEPAAFLRSILEQIFERDTKIAFPSNIALSQPERT
ncbi:MAG: hypothetical protein AAFQ24_03070 [Pseudomonadota bacterium]